MGLDEKLKEIESCFYRDVVSGGDRLPQILSALEKCRNQRGCSACEFSTGRPYDSTNDDAELLDILNHG